MDKFHTYCINRYGIKHVHQNEKGKSNEPVHEILEAIAYMPKVIFYMHAQPPSGARDLILCLSLN